MSLETSILLLQASLASLIRWLVNGAGVETNATSGLKSNGSSARLTPAGLWERTYRGYSQLSLDDSLQPFSLTWSRWGIVLDGEYTELVRSGHLTGVSGSSLWPTFLSTEAEHGGPNQRDSSGRLTLTSLAYYLWRTPQASDAKSSSTQQGYTTNLTHQVNRLWPTPTAIDGGTGRTNRSASPHAVERPTLARMARKGLWPTPTSDNANGARNFKTDGSKYRENGTYGQTLIDAVKVWRTPQADENGSIVAPEARKEYNLSLSNQVQGQLNPQWVECLIPTCVQNGNRSYLAFGLGSQNKIASQNAGWYDGVSARLDSARWPACPGQPQKEWEPQRVITTRYLNRTKRLKALGNTIVPQWIYPLFHGIVEMEKGTPQQRGESK